MNYNDINKEELIIEFQKLEQELNSLKALNKKEKEEKEKRASELIIANRELIYQNEEKEKRAAELIIANKELTFQNKEKEKRAAELIIANKELAYQNDEKEKRATELSIANKKFSDLNRDLDEKVKQRTLEIQKVNTKLLEEAAFRKKAEEKYQHIFENSVVGKSLTGVDGSLYVNKAFSDMLGYTLDELKILKWQEITYPDDINESSEIVDNLLKGKTNSARYVKRYIHKNGHIVWSDVSTSLQRDAEGKPFYFITNIIDITDRKLAEEELKNTLANLERSNKELEQFAYVASHDLQEPLRMISSYTQLLERRYKDKLDKDANDFIQFAVDGANRMQKLINDLLDYSRISSKGKEFTKVDLSQILGQTISNLHQLISENSAFVTNEDLPVLNVDESQIIRVFQNLIENAIKYKKKTELPKIHISCEMKNDFYEFAVRDNGIGIDMQFHDRIFIIFQRLHSKEEYSGTGIGLSICKRIIERHGGKIWFESKVNEGTTFYFTLKK